MCFNWNTNSLFSGFLQLASIVNMHPKKAILTSYRRFTSCAFAMRLNGQILHAQTYPLLAVDTEEGVGAKYVVGT